MVGGCNNIFIYFMRVVAIFCELLVNAENFLFHKLFSEKEPLLKIS